MVSKCNDSQLLAMDPVKDAIWEVAKGKAPSRRTPSHSEVRMCAQHLYSPLKFRNERKAELRVCVFGVVKRSVSKLALCLWR